MTTNPDAPALPNDWAERLRKETEKDYWSDLTQFVAKERQEHVVYPLPELTFRAFELTPYEAVKVVILGQDPYPNPGEAHGLAFSVPLGVKKPPSLRNIHKVLEADLSTMTGRPVTAPEHGNLEAWAREGVLLLNTALTVRAGTKKDRNFHRQWPPRQRPKAWATFTDAVIRAVNAKEERIVFILWGNDAKEKARERGEGNERLIDRDRHAVIESSHPSSYSAHLGFLDSHPFLEANEELTAKREIAWAKIGCRFDALDRTSAHEGGPNLVDPERLGLTAR